MKKRPLYWQGVLALSCSMCVRGGISCRRKVQLELRFLAQTTQTYHHSLAGSCDTVQCAYKEWVCGNNHTKWDQSADVFVLILSLRNGANLTSSLEYCIPTDPDWKQAWGAEGRGIDVDEMHATLQIILAIKLCFNNGGSHVGRPKAKPSWLSAALYRSTSTNRLSTIREKRWFGTNWISSY